MKKFLSLVLALVMTMSLVTISAGAKDFADDDKITYDEAVAVISTIGVVDGYEDGSFNPQGSLTRGAAAKIICNMILGPTTAAELHADTAPYKDVPVNHTFAGYIAYCAKEGIISGYADGTFRPAGTLTGYAFMKMLLGALGYDAAIEGYTGANWSINVAKQAIAIGLNGSLEGDFNGIKAVNREEAALYAFNTLKADLVEYDTTISTTINGQTVTIGNSKAKAMEWLNSASRQKNIKDDKYVQFAEQYFNKLYLNNVEDAFGRPSRNWEYKGQEIGTYLNKDLLIEEYTEKVTGLDLYTLLGKSVIDDYTTTVYIDGISDKKVDENIFTAADMNKNNKEKVGATGDGVLTQVFQNTDDKEITIAIINTYLAIADSDYSAKKEEASFDVYAISKTGDEYIKNKKNDKPVTLKASLDDFDVEDVKKDDAYLVNVAEGEIQILTQAEVVEDTEISAFKLGSNVTAGGTKYSYADTAKYDVEVLDQYTNTKINLKDVTYNIYLDVYGNLIGVDLVETPNNYVFITGIDSSYSNLYTKNVDAAGIFIDGTMDTITVSTSKSTLETTASPITDYARVNRWYTYTVSNDGVYTLKLVADVTTAGNTYVPGGKDNNTKVAQFASATYNTVIDKKHINLPGGGTTTFAKVYGNDDTVYLTASIKEIATKDGSKPTAIIVDDVDSVTTGIKSANIQPWTHVGGESNPCEICKADNGIKTNSAVTGGRYSSGVYTLYKSNGYIIATVVVGEDSAASKNLVYAHTSKVEMEAYDKTADEWTWTRKVVSDGQEIEIKEVSDALTWLDIMDQYKWYQVKYNAEGEVISVAKVDGITTLTNGTDYEDVIGDLETTVNSGKDTVLYTQGFKNDHPEMKSSVLYVTSTIAANNGFIVAEDANIVLIQTNKNKEDVTFETSADTLEDIINDLNEKNGKFDYEISAILENGIATTVVVYDKTNTYQRPASYEDVVITLDNPTTIEYFDPADAPEDEDEAVDMIEAEIERLGYTVTSKSYDGTKYTWKVKDAKGFSVPDIEFTYNSTSVYQVYTVDLKIADTLKTAAPDLTAKADVKYVKAGGTVTVTIKNPTAIGAVKYVDGKDADGNTIGSQASSSTGSTTVTAVWTMPNDGTAAAVILTLS